VSGERQHLPGSPSRACAATETKFRSGVLLEPLIKQKAVNFMAIPLIG
jgi:hypothetical protein